MGEETTRSKEGQREIIKRRKALRRKAKKGRNKREGKRCKEKGKWTGKRAEEKKVVRNSRKSSLRKKVKTQSQGMEERDNQRREIERPARVRKEPIRKKSL